MLIFSIKIDENRAIWLSYGILLVDTKPETVMRL